MLLEDLPEKVFNRLLKSVTWTEIQGISASKHWMRRSLARAARPSRWVARVRKMRHHP
jgi:hypothetical protein